MFVVDLNVYADEFNITANEILIDKENEIINLKKTAEEFQLKKFGPEGEIYRKPKEYNIGNNP